MTGEGIENPQQTTVAAETAETLITGATGMLGQYMLQHSGYRIVSLGHSGGNDIVCDLRTEIPDLCSHDFRTVIHCAGTEDDAEALSLNYEGTLNLLRGLGNCTPRYFVYVSSHEVYSHDAGMGITEDTPLWATSKTGQSKALAEKAVTEWCDARGVTLTILRPAPMFGNGVSGKMLRLFNEAVTGRYIHIRGNEARLSIVCAIDVANAAYRLCKTGGVFNVADGINPRLIDLVEAMTMNAGSQKRSAFLPEQWASFFWKYFRFVPIVREQLNPERLKRNSTTRTIDNTKCREESGIDFFNTIEVISRQSKSYPYTSEI